MFGEGNVVGGGADSITLLNKSELLSHFSNSSVCFAYTNVNYLESSRPTAPPPPKELMKLIDNIP